MRKAYRLIPFVLALAGCSGSPPKPPMPEGDYRPINSAPRTSSASEFDFSYDGDISGALVALKKVVPHITIVPPYGSPVPVPVRVRLQKTTLESCLHTISMQAGDKADVAVNVRFFGNEKYVNTFVRYYNPAAYITEEPQNG